MYLIRLSNYEKASEQLAGLIIPASLMTERQGMIMAYGVGGIRGIFIP